LVYSNQENIKFAMNLHKSTVKQIKTHIVYIIVALTTSY